MGRVRFGIIVACIVCAYGGLLFRLYDVQVLRGDQFVAKAHGRLLVNAPIEAQRGIIKFLDKSGAEIGVAMNKELPRVYASPKTLVKNEADIQEVSHQLASLMGIPADDIAQKLAKKDADFVLLGRKLLPAVADSVANAGIDGIYVDTQPERFYPFGVRASHVLGYVGPRSDGTGVVGQYGAERFYEDRLAGTPGKVIEGGVIEPQSGDSVTLSIELNIQEEAERVLGDVISKYGAAGGTVIVQEVKTGKIVALASAPSFDPNSYADAPVASFKNPALQDLYEPGSVFKVITMAAGIDSGKLTPNTTYVDKGSLTISGRTIKNYDFAQRGAYGKIDMTTVIEHSINTGAVFAQRQIGRTLFREYLDRFGFGEKTGIGLPGEVAGDLRRLTPKERDIAFATASYGQGVAVTPLEVINAFSAIANGGLLMRPYIEAGKSPEVVRRVISADAARQTTEMMVSAVDTAKVAKIEGYSIGGKTGTAYIPDFVNGGYTERVIHTYVGFGPASDARYAVLLKINDLEDTMLAGTTVVPAFRELMQFVVNYYQIPPDRIEQRPQ